MWKWIKQMFDSSPTGEEVAAAAWWLASHHGRDINDDTLPSRRYDSDDYIIFIDIRKNTVSIVNQPVGREVLSGISHYYTSGWWCELSRFNDGAWRTALMMDYHKLHTDYLLKEAQDYAERFSPLRDE